MRSEKQHDLWPTQPLPTDEQWTIWREFINQRYIKDGHLQFHLELTPVYHIPQAETVDIEEGLHSLYTTLQQQQTNDYYITHLPRKYQMYIQYWEDDNNVMLDHWTC